MAQEPRRELPRERREAELVALVVEGVALAAEERELEVHARAVVLGEGLRHEGRVDPVPQRHLLHDDAVGHDRVGHRERVGVAQIHLVLARRHLVVGEGDPDPELLEHQHRLAPEIGGLIERGQVEVAPLVERLGAAGILEVEELDLRGDVEGEAHAGRPRERALEHRPRVSREGLAPDPVDVAKHTCDCLLPRAPRQKLEGRLIGDGQHVRLARAREAADRGSVEGDAVRERVLELLHRDGHRLEHPQDVGEPEADELHIVIAARLQDVLARARLIHRTAPAERRPEPPSPGYTWKYISYSYGVGRCPCSEISSRFQSR